MGFRRVIIGLLCLAGLAVVLDFGVAAYSEYRVSRLLREGSNLSADPEVWFHGFPFVVQAMNGDYPNVDIHARVMRPDIPGEIGVEANLRGAHVPMSDLVDGKVSSVPVDQVEARLRIEPNELGRLFQIPDLQVFGPPADKSDGSGGTGGTGGGQLSGKTDPGTIILNGTVSLNDGPALEVTTNLGKKSPTVSVLAELRLVDDQVRIIATDIYRSKESVLGGNDDAPTLVVSEADKPRVLAMFTRTIDTRDLPFGIVPTKVEASGGQIVVEGKGKNVTIDLDRLQQP